MNPKKPVDTMKAAVSVLLETESRLNGLMRDAIALARYEDVRMLASAAARIAEARQGLNSAGEGGELIPIESAYRNDSSTNREVPQTRTAWHAQVANSRESRSLASGPIPRPSRGDYPIFAREDGRLVKIGWSARDRRTYEHRVPKEAVVEICRTMANKTNLNQAFKVEDLLPIKLSDRTDAPSYQTYLVLKWLQELDVVERRGKEGYLLKAPVEQGDVFDQLWSKTAARG